MEVVNDSVEGILNYFVENIKETQKNGYNKKEVISCLLDLHINTLNVLEQIGSNKEEQIRIKILLYDCFIKREEEKLKALWTGKGESHE